MNKTRLIIGLGSGRCGTTSLSYLLNMQINTYCSHETYISEKYGLNFQDDLNGMVYCLFDVMSWNVPVVGDVGYYWLNYVPHILAYVPNTKFVCMKRDKEGTLNSFKKHQADSKFFIPGFDYEQYYDEYYRVAKNFEKHYPDQFKIFDINCLNVLEGQISILDFCGFENKLFKVPLKLNVNAEKGR